jgi:hypothetical protein
MEGFKSGAPVRTKPRTPISLKLRFDSKIGGTVLTRNNGRNESVPPGQITEVDLFGDGKGVIDLDAEISDGALDLAMAEQ